MNILEIHQQLFPHLQSLIDQLRIYHQEKLWKQLSDTLLEYIKDPALSQGTHIKDLYDGLINKFYSEIDELKLVKFLVKAADQYGEFDNRITFLEKFSGSLDVQPALVIKLKQAYFMLQQGKIQEVDELLKSYKKQCERIQEVEPLVYSMLYYLAFSFYRLKQNYEEFYVNALQYLAYTPDTDMLDADKVALSFEMGLAILISPNIYNFSELLQQPLVLSLKESAHKWIYTLLEIFNRGDVHAFNQHMAQYTLQVTQQPLLKDNLTQLQEKIRIMAFLELAFQLPKNARICSFVQLSQVTHLDINQIERLVMRTISRGLVKGSINQVNQTVSVTYVMPRVLSIDKVEVMMKKFTEWDRTLQGFLGDVNKQREQLN